MDVLNPAISEPLLDRFSGEAEPQLIEPDALLVGARHPDHHRRRIHRLAQARIQAAGTVRGSLPRPFLVLWHRTEIRQLSAAAKQNYRATASVSLASGAP